MPMEGLHFDKITKRFGDTVAVNALSLQINRGELFFLIGPSGCGKTTSLRMVAGFEEPDSGAIYLGQKELSALPAHKRETGMVFQNYALWPHLSVRGNVEYGLKVRKISKDQRQKQVLEALAMVRLEGMESRYPNQLSGGQQQRVALARALVIRPDVLLLDEPLSNLDARLRLEMRHEIRRLHQATGITTLYVTHDQEEALSVASRVAILNEGNLQQVGTPREIYQHPKNRFVAGFIGETNFISGTFEGTENGYSIIQTAAGTLTANAVDNPPQTGTKVLCSVRPEAFKLLNNEPSNMPNLFHGKMRDVMYLGNSDQYQVKVVAAEADNDNSWDAIKVLSSNPGLDAPNVGQKVLLHCKPQDVAVLDQV